MTSRSKTACLPTRSVVGAESLTQARHRWSLSSPTFTTSQNLTISIWCALGAGAVIALWRLLRRQSLQQVLGGFGGVALSAFIAGRTGNAADFFLPGLLINLAYGLAFAISALVRWPLVGLGVGAATGDLTGWRKDPQLRRAYYIATWLWAGMFGLKLAVQLPLYFAELVGALGIAKIVMGWPLMLIVGLITYRLVKTSSPPTTVGSAREDSQSDTFTAVESEEPRWVAAPLLGHQSASRFSNASLDPRR